MAESFKDLGELLLERRIIDELQFRKAREHQMRRGGSIGRVCVELGIVGGDRLATTIAKALNLPLMALGPVAPDAAGLALVPRGMAAGLSAFPYKFRDKGRMLWMALGDPTEPKTLAELHRTSGCAIQVSVASFSEIDAAIDRHYGPDQGLALEEGDPDEVFHITDMAGNTQVKFKLSQPPPMDEPKPANSTSAPGIPDETRRLFARIEEQFAQSRSALEAVLELCLERGVIDRDELAKRLRR